MFIKAILIALLAGIAGVDLYDGLFHIHRPIVTGPLVGLLLGDVRTGIIAGASLELVWAGMVPLGGAQPPNVVIGGIVGTAFAILTKQDPGVAIGIAVPFAVAVQALITLLFTAYSPVMHRMDRCAEEVDVRSIEKLNYLGILILFIVYFVIAFLPVYFGAVNAGAIIGATPKWVIEGLKIAGGIMPAIGFAMLLKMMFDWKYVPFFAVGFVAVAYLKLPVLAVALIGASIAGYDLYRSKDNKENEENEEEKKEIIDGEEMESPIIRAMSFLQDDDDDEESYVDAVEERVIDNKLLNRMTWRSLLLQASFNYERMQAGGWLYTILPGLERIHSDESDLSHAMKDHLQLFNTNPFIVTFISGIVISMEERKQPRDIINNIKVALMGALGGIGDALFWLTLLPLTAGIGASISLKGNILGPIVFLVLFNAVHIVLLFGLMRVGYRAGNKAINFVESSAEKISRAAKILGLTVVGGLIASYVKFNIPIKITLGSTVFDIQKNFLDKIMPCFLPLAYTVLCYWLMKKKDISPVFLILITIAIGILMGILGLY